MKILIVDDDPATRLRLKRIPVRDFKCAVTEVDNGLDALERLPRDCYSFVMRDILMPDCSQ